MEPLLDIESGARPCNLSDTSAARLSRQHSKQRASAVVLRSHSSISPFMTLLA